MNNQTDYEQLCRNLRALTENVPYEVANLSNASALLWQWMETINWVGFYCLEEPDALILGPFQGKPACIRIPVGKGVCGTAVAKDTVVMVEDVHRFPGHIACDSASRSEIVVPIHKDNRVWGVLDIDSPVEARFSREDSRGLVQVCRILEDILR